MHARTGLSALFSNEMTYMHLAVRIAVPPDPQHTMMLLQSLGTVGASNCG